MFWFWSSGGSILPLIKKNVGRKINMTPRKIQSPVFFSPVNHRHPHSSAFWVADMNVFGLGLCCFVHFSLPFRHDTHINTCLIWILSFKTCWKIRFGRFMLWFKKKEKRSPGPPDQFSKINWPEPKFFFPGLILFNNYSAYKLTCSCQSIHPRN